jgi:hypothetical protein
LRSLSIAKDNSRKIKSPLLAVKQLRELVPIRGSDQFIREIVFKVSEKNTAGLRIRMPPPAGDAACGVIEKPILVSLIKGRAMIADKL